MDKPKVTIGLPVYNGEKYLATAIESVLNQSYRDFELIISDNASIDRTQEICETYAARDQRVRYYRNEQNLGAAPNFNRVFELARGEYFQWLSHDDMLAPEFLERCVPVLDADPTTVLCFSWVQLIDEHSENYRAYELQLRIDAPHPRTRYRDILLAWHGSFYVFGLIRASTLQQTKLILPYSHGDTILIARLSLLGRFHQVPEYLFISRNHPDQSSRVYKAALPRGLDFVAYTAWYDVRAAKGLRHPYWRMMVEFYKTMGDIDLNLTDRIACHYAFALFALRNVHGLMWDFGGLPRRFVRAVSFLRNKKYDGSRMVESR